MTILVDDGKWGVNQKVAKKCKIEISGKKNFWQGPKMGTGKMLIGWED